MTKIAAIMLAGGKGSRMGLATPKQFLTLNEKPIAHYSIETFLSAQLFDEIIVVVSPEYQSLFSAYSVTFASPGERRQDSVFSGLQHISSQIEWVCVHDCARPFVKSRDLLNLVEVGKKWNAATLAVTMKSTIKEGSAQGVVVKTLPREVLWEVQTPQFLSRSLLEKGFQKVHELNATVTDDVSIAELLEHPVKLVEGCYSNIKITTPDDLSLATILCKNTK